ncbi:hypothetical protein M9Y10_039249 [Tritrichomonas musculus]|uniref:Protein kinase domain-containing protein n=1 Tax=Tritrichomonas musculus TaxID=1915356 RepID=A0ABR2KDT4_9EUKA
MGQVFYISIKGSLTPLKKTSSCSTPKKENSPYMFDINDYKKISIIGKGSFGIIYLAQNKINGEEYAAKTNLIQNESLSKLLISREIRIMSQFQHPTIIQFKGFSFLDFDGCQNITILMEYMKNGSLATLIDLETKSLCPSNYDNTKRQIILVGIARGMMLLHKQYIIHRDLKPENILLDSDFHPRITDFGLSKIFDPLHSMRQSISNSGTAAYMAPEVITGDRFNTKADVYAFGILMYEVIGGKRAYSDLLHGKNPINIYQLKKKIELEDLHPKFDFPITKSLQQMIEKCWSRDPKERPTFNELFKKLSLSSEDFFFDFEGNYEEPKIVDDDEDDENEEDFKYCLPNVDIDELLDYVDEIQAEAPKTIKENDGLREQMKKMEDEISSLKKKFDEQSTQEAQTIQAMQNKISNQEKIILSLQNEVSTLKTKESANEAEITKLMKVTIKDQEDKIKSLEAQILLHQKRFGRFFSVDLSKEEPGILAQLKERQKSPFDKLFVASQSSNDIYTLIVPEKSFIFGTSNSGKAYIEFELESEVTICGAKIFTGNDYHAKSFDIVIEGKTVKSIKDATELNGTSKNMTVNFEPIRGRKIRFIQTGPCWAGHNYINTKGFELLSTDEKYSKGVFATLVEESENNDPHKCPVIIYAQCFDHNCFYSLKPQTNIFTWGCENSWFQVELTRGTAIIIGFRLKRCDIMLKTYKLICTDDPSKPESSWTTLIEINEKAKDEHEDLDIYEFPHPSPPTRFVRLVQTGKNWNDSYVLSFYHFDLFGSYF